jgi:restriction system protein
MAIPDFQSLMLPLLKLAGDGNERSIRDSVELLAKQFALSEEERRELLPSGQQARFDNRVHWARSFLKQARVLENTKRGYFRITERGRQLLAENPKTLNMKTLERYPEYVEFREKRTEGEEEASGGAQLAHEVRTPEEALEQSHKTLTEALAAEVIQRIKDCSPAFFEKVVVELLVRMGYGGTQQEAGKAVGRSGDEGIDGIINEDRLGLDAIYLQAKRWRSPVGRPEIMKFVGAVQGKRAHKGVFITTSSFTREAQDYTSNIANKVVLIDGRTLALLMIENNVGVSLAKAFEVKRIDSDYFSEE